MTIIEEPTAEEIEKVSNWQKHQGKRVKEKYERERDARIKDIRDQWSEIIEDEIKNLDLQLNKWGSVEEIVITLRSGRQIVYYEGSSIDLVVPPECQ